MEMPAAMAWTLRPASNSPLVALLTFRKIGQMFLIGFQGPTLSPEIRHLIEYYYIGNIIFARRNIVGIGQTDFQELIAQILYKPLH
jgi:hypothetical protein